MSFVRCRLVSNSHFLLPFEHASNIRGVDGVILTRLPFLRSEGLSLEGVPWRVPDAKNHVPWVSRFPKLTLDGFVEYGSPSGGCVQTFCRRKCVS